MPDFSIIIPCFNDGKYAVDAIESCVRQSYLSYEIIFIDDGSTDFSFEEVSRRYANNSQVKCFSKINSGPSSARNFGLGKSTGEYILFLDSDDLLMENYLSHARRLIDNTVNCHEWVFVMPFNYSSPLSSSRAKMFWKYSPPILGRNKFLNMFKLSLMNCFPISAAIFSRKIVDEHILFDDDIDCYEDWDFWIRVAKSVSGFTYGKYVREASTCIRIRDGLSSNVEKMESRRRRVFRKNFSGTIFMFFLLPFFGDFLRKVIIFLLRLLRRKKDNPNITPLAGFSC